MAEMLDIRSLACMKLSDPAPDASRPLDKGSHTGDRQRGLYQKILLLSSGDPRPLRRRPPIG